MLPNRSIWVTLIIFLAAIVLVACSSNSSEELGSSPSPPTGESNSPVDPSPTPIPPSPTAVPATSTVPPPTETPIPATKTPTQEPTAVLIEYVATSPEDLVGDWVSPLGYDLRFISTGEFLQTIELSAGGGYYEFKDEQLNLDSRSCRKWDDNADDWVFFGCVASYTVYVTKEDDSIVMLRFDLIDDPDSNRSKGLVENPWTRVEE